MKKITLLLLLNGIIFSLAAQQRTASHSDSIYIKKELAKIQQSVSLSEEEESVLFSSLYSLHQQRILSIRNHQHTPSLGQEMQRINYSKDSVFRAVLGHDRYHQFKSDSNRKRIESESSKHPSTDVQNDSTHLNPNR